MILDPYLQKLTEGFINSVAVGHGLDERTVKAYRLDLELFFRWLKADGEESKEGRKDKEGRREQEGGKEQEGRKDQEDRRDQEGRKDKEGKRDQEGEEDKADKCGRNGCGDRLDNAISYYDQRDIHIFPLYSWECKMEEYLWYLSREKRRRFSTLCRKYLVFGYFLSYLKEEGVIQGFREFMLPNLSEETTEDTFLTKSEVDAFFQAIDREYTGLDSDFRKRVCLRDQVMMELLFYHRIEISELLRMEVTDYNRKTAVLTIRRKKEKGCSVYLYSRNLQKRMGQWLDEHGYFEHGGLYDNRMFLSKLGKPLSMKMVTNIFEKYRVLAGIKKACTPKDLKNSLERYGVEMVRERG